MPRVLNKSIDKIPAGAVYVGRPSKFGNLFKVGAQGTREQCIELYREFLGRVLEIEPDFLEELRGKDLVCWCHTWDGQGHNPMYCHADLLLELANKEASTCLDQGRE